MGKRLKDRRAHDPRRIVVKRLITCIKNTRPEGGQPFSPSVWAASPEIVAKDTAELAALSDEEKAVATKVLTGFAKMSAAFDHGA